MNNYRINSTHLTLLISSFSGRFSSSTPTASSDMAKTTFPARMVVEAVMLGKPLPHTPVATITFLGMEIGRWPRELLFTIQAFLCYAVAFFCRLSSPIVAMAFVAAKLLSFGPGTYSGVAARNTFAFYGFAPPSNPVTLKRAILRGPAKSRTVKPSSTFIAHIKSLLISHGQSLLPVLRTSTTDYCHAEVVA